MPKRKRAYSYRKIQGLKWAQLSSSGPIHNLRPKRLRGCRAAGIAYERKVGRYLEKLVQGAKIRGKLYSSRWIHFEDRNGFGYAQPDHFVVSSARIILLECKLSQVGEAWPQMLQLYAPLLEEIFQKPVESVLVCKNLRFDTASLVSFYTELQDRATWHWLGQEVI